MAGPLELAIQGLKELGFFNVLLPFLLVFTVLYGILERTKIFGDKKHDINAVVAFSISMMVIGTTWVVGAITEFLPYVGMISIVLVSLLLLAGMMFSNNLEGLLKEKWFQTGGVIIIIIVISLSLMYIFGLKLTTGRGYILGISVNDFATIMGLILFFALIVWMVRPESSNGGSK